MLRVHRYHQKRRVWEHSVQGLARAGSGYDREPETPVESGEIIARRYIPTWDPKGLGPAGHSVQIPYQNRCGKCNRPGGEDPGNTQRKNPSLALTSRISIRAFLFFPVIFLSISCAESAPRPKAKAWPVGEALGIGMHLGNLPLYPENITERAFKLAANREAGIRVIRWDFAWDRIEPEPGIFVFEPFDEVVNEALSQGQTFLGVLGYGNPWASILGSQSDDPFYPPDDPSDFAHYVYHTVSHFKDRVTEWEVWNEPNAGYRFWKTDLGGDPKAYGDLLKAAYTAAKEVCPECRIGFAGLYFHEIFIPGALKFTEEVFSHHPDIADYFDAYCLHPYPIYPPSVPPEYGGGNEIPIIEMIDSVRNLLERYQAGEKALWITELGWPTYGKVGYENQARYLVRSFILSLSRGIERIFWFTFDDGPESGNPEHDFGLFEYDPDYTDSTPPNPKSSYLAYQTLSRMLGDTCYLGDLSDKMGLADYQYGFEFGNNTKTVKVFWTTSADGSESISLDLKEEDQLFGMLGEEISISTGEAGIPLSQSPIYLVRGEKPN